MEPFQMNLWIGLAVMLIYGLLCGGWIYLLMRNAKPGWRRLQPAVPVMVLNCLIPFIFNPTLVPQRHSLFSALPRMVSSFCFMWVGNFKVGMVGNEPGIGKSVDLTSCVCCIFTLEYVSCFFFLGGDECCPHLIRCRF